MNAMKDNIHFHNRNTIVTITDKTYLTVVYLLLLSIRFNKVQAKINVLCVNLSAEDKAILTQLDGVECFDGDQNNTRSPATRKAEAILTAEGDGVEYVTLLDGDGLCIGDISHYLCPGIGFSSRIKSEAEESWNFRTRYEKSEHRGGVPQKILDIWRVDVGEMRESRMKNTVTSGNLTVHKSCFDFMRKWHDQMMKVLPLEDPGMPYHFDNFAYHQMDESVLNSLLAFAEDAPDVIPGKLDVDADAYVAHLGPAKPRPWVLLRYEKLKYFSTICELIDWAENRGFKNPPLPWTFTKRNKPFVFAAAYVHWAYDRSKRVARTFLNRVRGAG